MSLFAEMQAAASEAQNILAQLQGMAATADGNFIYNGQTYTGVFGQPQITDSPNAGGGYKRQAVLSLTATRDQFDAAPASKARLTRTVPDHIEYLIDAVDIHGPLHYVLFLVKVGD